MEKHGVGFANILKFVICLNRGIELLQLILTKKRTVQKVLQLLRNDAIKKKITEGNARNSRLSNCVEVTKNQKNTRGSERMSKIRAQAITPACSECT